MAEQLYKLMTEYFGGSKIDFSEVPLKNVVQKSNHYLSNTDMVSAELEAQKFYLYQHALHVISEGKTPNCMISEGVDPFYDFQEHMTSAVHKAFHYMLLITHREARHLDDIKSIDAEPELIKEQVEITKLCQNQSHGKSYQVLCGYDGSLSLGQYVRYLVVLFNQGKWSSSSFGGKAWGGIAQVLSDYVHGKLTGVEFVDTMFTLSHNNGAIFNKNIVYKPHKSSEFLTILDVQRAGMIPQYVRHQSPDKLNLVELFNNLLPYVGRAFDGHVDWQRVEDLGAVQKYEMFKKDSPKPIVVSEPKKKGKADYEKLPAGTSVLDGNHDGISYLSFPHPAKDGSDFGSLLPIIKKVV